MKNKRKNTDKLPLGIKLIIALLIIMAIFSISFIFLEKISIMIRFFLTGFFVIILLMLAIGLSEKDNLARIGTIILFLIGILLEIFTIIIKIESLEEPIITRTIIAIIIIIYLASPDVVKIFQK